MCLAPCAGQREALAVERHGRLHEVGVPVAVCMDHVGQREDQLPAVERDKRFPGGVLPEVKLIGHIDGDRIGAGGPRKLGQREDGALSGGIGAVIEGEIDFRVSCLLSCGLFLLL